MFLSHAYEPLTLEWLFTPQALPRCGHDTAGRFGIPGE
jgi:hypothetical protein